jgi:hypothetical protein
VGRPALDKMSIEDKDTRIAALEAALMDVLTLAEIVAHNAGGSTEERRGLRRTCDGARRVLFPIG